MALGEFHLSIADFIIRICNRSGLHMLLEDGYMPFRCDDGKADMTVQVHAGIPSNTLADATCIYSAVQDGSELWRIERDGHIYRFTVFDQDDATTVNQVAYTSDNFCNWDIHCRILEQEGEQGICPLLYPMGPLLMYHLTLNHDALLVHGSAVFDGERGRVFSGFSGVGKSTLARIWKEHGATVINDDRLIIRRKGEGYTVHNTPMFYTDEPRQAPLHAIFLPYHNPENRISPLIGAEAAAQILAYCIQHGYDKAHVGHRLDCVHRLCARVPVHSLGVVPNGDIIPFIQQHEQHR
jgi:hypothetical protein